MKILENIGILCWVELCIALTKNLAGAQKPLPPSAAFNKHSIVRPVLLHKRTKREISSTRDEDGLHHLEVTMKVPIDGEEYILDLHLNQDLVPDNHVLSYQENGKTVLHKPTKEEMDLCHYSGSVRGKPGSWVAVSTCHGVQGTVFDGERMRYIEPVQGGDVNADHYIVDHLDLMETRPGRGCGNQASNYPQHNSYESRRTRYKRDASDEIVFNETYQANDSSLYVELVLVVDKRTFESHHRDRQSVHREMKAVANVVNSYYSSLNIFIVLVGVVVWNEHDMIILDKIPGPVLTNFKQYRTSTLLKEIRHDNAHLVTKQEFEGGVVGLAYKGPLMCTFEWSCGFVNHAILIGNMAWTIAHEMGHNFAMDHDAELKDCECPRKTCIMGATGEGEEGWKRTSTSYKPSHWSSCSLNSLTLTLSKESTRCLRNKPSRLFYSATCGNGVVEAGEQCDCGRLSQDTYNCHTCCDPNTCMPRANATCAAGRCCDLQTCHLKSAGTECRAAERECDLPEYCSGHSANCPEDVHKMDTTPCGKDEQNAYCVKGGCHSHLDQCRALWGSTAESCASFYKFNLGGDWGGNCGYDPFSKVYTPCPAADVMCGRLYCKYQSKGKTVGCHSTINDVGLDVVDFGFVQDGAKCGEEKVCLKQRCVSVAAIREKIAHYESSVCPSNCSEHGVCNSKGHCHCDGGYAPPLCALPGPGGSYDSEPATDQTSLTNFMVAMYVIFLGIVPAIALVLLIIHFWDQITVEAWKKYKQKPNFKPSDRISCIAGNDSPIYDTTTAACRLSTIYANIEEISSQKTHDQKMISIVLPLKGDGQVYSTVKPTSKLNYLSREIRPKLQDTNSRNVITKPRPVVKSIPKSNSSVSEVENKAQVDIKPLVIGGRNSNNSTGNIQTNTQVNNSEALKIKPLVKTKSKFNNSESELEHKSQVAINEAFKIEPLNKLNRNYSKLTSDALKIKPLMKTKPISKNSGNELQANVVVANTDALKIKPSPKPKPNFKNLASELQANHQVANTDILKIKPSPKPKPNFKNLASELQANHQVANTDILKIKPSPKPKPNFKNLASELQANHQVANTDILKIKPMTKPKSNSKILAGELETNTIADNKDVLKNKTLLNPKSNFNNLVAQFQANAQADNSGTHKIEPLVKPKHKPNH